jgi:hypothetical protein
MLKIYYAVISGALMKRLLISKLIEYLYLPKHYQETRVKRKSFFTLLKIATGRSFNR